MGEIALIVVFGFLLLVVGACCLFGGGTDLAPATPENPICKKLDEVTAKAEQFHEKYQK